MTTALWCLPTFAHPAFCCCCTYCCCTVVPTGRSRAELRFAILIEQKSLHQTNYYSKSQCAGPTKRPATQSLLCDCLASCCCWCCCLPTVWASVEGGLHCAGHGAALEPCGSSNSSCREHLQTSAQHQHQQCQLLARPALPGCISPAKPAKRRCLLFQLLSELLSSCLDCDTCTAIVRSLLVNSPSALGQPLLLQRLSPDKSDQPYCLHCGSLQAALPVKQCFCSLRLPPAARADPQRSYWTYSLLKNKIGVLWAQCTLLPRCCAINTYHGPRTARNSLTNSFCLASRFHCVRRCLLAWLFGGQRA